MNLRRFSPLGLLTSMALLAAEPAAASCHPACEAKFAWLPVGGLVAALAALVAVGALVVAAAMRA